MKEILTALMIWIAEQTGYIMPNEPDIVFLNESVLKNEFCLVNANTEDEYQDCLSKDFNIAAFYNIDRKTIYLSHDWDSQNVLHVETLLHELVHHFQIENGVTDNPNCLGQMEKEAYLLGRFWLQQQGVSEEYYLLHNIMIRLAENCGFSL